MVLGSLTSCPQVPPRFHLDVWNFLSSVKSKVTEEDMETFERKMREDMNPALQIFPSEPFIAADVQHTIWWYVIEVFTLLLLWEQSVISK